MPPRSELGQIAFPVLDGQRSWTTCPVLWELTPYELNPYSKQLPTLTDHQAVNTGDGLPVVVTYHAVA